MNMEIPEYREETYEVWWDATAGCLRVKMKGEHDLDSAKEFLSVIERCWEEHEDLHEASVIVDVSELQGVSRDARKYYSDGGEPFRFPRIAILGMGAIHRALMSFMVFTTKRSDRMKAVVTEGEALAWFARAGDA